MFSFCHFFSLYYSVSCWVLYNLGVQCRCTLAVSGIAMAQPPTLLLLIEMDWGKTSLSSLSLLTHTGVVNTHATLVWVLPFSTHSSLQRFSAFYHVPSCYTYGSFFASALTFLSFEILFVLLRSLPPYSLRTDIMHFSNQLCCDWTEMIWLDPVSIVDPLVKLLLSNSFPEWPASWAIYQSKSTVSGMETARIWRH